MSLLFFGPGSQMFVSYNFDGERKRAWIRRIHFTGYFEDAPQ